MALVLSAAQMRAVDRAAIDGLGLPGMVLMENAGRVVSQHNLLEQVWGREYIDDIYYPRVYISQLRRKLERDAANPLYILTEHRVGYRFEKHPAAAPPSVIL